MSETNIPAPPPHVLIFPFPAQGHVNSMLKLAELLCLAGAAVTYLVSPNIRHRLLLHSDVETRFSKYRGFHLLALPGGVYEGKIQSADEVVKLYDSLNLVAVPFLRKLLSRNSSRNGAGNGNGNVNGGVESPITCVIADGILSIALDVGEEIGVPVMYFRTVSACAFWAYFCIPQMIEAGEIPFSENEMDLAVNNVKGMEAFLRRRDLPSFCRSSDIKSPDFQMLLNETGQTPRARGLIMNTFDDLEGPVLSQIKNHCPNLYTIGPLHAHLKSKLAANSSSSSTNSLWEEDRSCIQWLDSQPPKSVLYVSFGSVVVVTKDQLLEFWRGLADSGVKFLWVIRADLIARGNDDDDGYKETRSELEEATRERGYMVEWAPQEEVLAHPAVGGFWTHSGWNSTLESIAAGVPMMTWPYFADQQTNSRFVAEVWKNGLDMKDTCDRAIVEKMIKELMVVKKVEFLKRATELAELAKKSIADGGSSFCNLDNLIRDLQSLGSK